MTINDIKNICVVGAGNMGHQISLLCAIHGYKTTCTDVIPDILKKAEKFADTYLPLYTSVNPGRRADRRFGAAHCEGCG
jgi:3-hydroxyacyl-CoA dehydrogenase